MSGYIYAEAAAKRLISLGPPDPELTNINKTVIHNQILPARCHIDSDVDPDILFSIVYQGLRTYQIQPVLN